MIREEPAPRRQPTKRAVSRSENDPPDLTNLERLAATIHVVPRNLELYRAAMTHRSAAGVSYPGTDKPAEESNERLEFLGDAVLGAVAAEVLYRRFPDESEGVLTRRRSAIVRTEQLATWASELSLDRFMYLAPGERASESGRDRILAGAYEALVGAIFLDRGLNAARTFINHQLRRDIEAIVLESATSNPKGRLQELTQDLHRRAPVYRTLKADGPPHARHFTVEVSFEGKPLAEGEGSSKRAAEEAAADAALQVIYLEGPAVLTARLR
ncbi:ribonuclease III [soil metagenome]